MFKFILAGLTLFFATVMPCNADLCATIAGSAYKRCLSAGGSPAACEGAACGTFADCAIYWFDISWEEADAYCMANAFE